MLTLINIGIRRGKTITRDYNNNITNEGAVDFASTQKQYYHPRYNKMGSLVSDAGRKIAHIDYDNMNNPVRIQFMDGNVTKYIYSATGEKLRVIYITAVPNISIPVGNVKELSPSEILCKDSTDYLLRGNLILRNGRIDKYQFEEGYCQAEAYSSTKDRFTFCYYDRDHLGSVRQVTEADGSKNGYVIQTANYYPFGGELCQGDAKISIQSHKYNGKEFDRVHGLNIYDYGARQYNPVTGRWDRMDNLSEKKPWQSGYLYCSDNPVNKVDPDGNDDYFSNTGIFLYSRGTGPNMYIRQGNVFVNMANIRLNSYPRMHMAANVVGHYARQVGIKYNRNGGKGTVGVSTMHDTDKIDMRVLAGTIEGNISIKVENGYFDDYMYNTHQLKSTLIHESEHKDDYFNKKEYSNPNLRHSEIILKEMASADFAKSTSEYKKAQQKQFMRYLRQARKEHEDVQLMYILNAIYNVLMKSQN